jgi:SAM-dependent methyltransferase
VSISASRIDDYAKSMFARESLNAQWISNCADYLRAAFGEKIKGAVFLDYAFGRGNWSVAALEAGASHVIAIDASLHNVEKLTAYCRVHGIAAIEVIHGNIMDGPMAFSADVLWIYGILHHIPDPADFLSRIAALRRDDDALALLYAYDKGSLRQIVVELARAGHVYTTFEAFEADSLLYSPAARLRARDDLTAPHIGWFSQDDLADLARGVGMHAFTTCADFPRWKLPAEAMLEFRPQHLVCGFKAPLRPLPAEPIRPEATDNEIIEAVGRAFVAEATPGQLRLFPIGLCNTHFVHGRTLADQLVQDFLFVAYAIVKAGITPQLTGVAQDVWQATLASSAGQTRDLDPELLNSSAIARYVVGNSVRF